MSATQPTRRPWHSGTDAIWADSAAAADAESAPSNGEIVAGHVQNTGFTSGRANWLFAAAAEWFQRVRDTLLPQHTDDGDHYGIRCYGVEDGTKAAIYGINGEDPASRLLQCYDYDGGAEVAYVTQAGAMAGATVSQTSTTNRTIVLPGNSGTPLSSGTVVYGTSTPTIYYDNNDGTTRIFQYHVRGIPEHATGVKYRVVCQPNNASNTVDATAYFADNGDNGTGSSNGSITQITGVTGVQGGEVNFSTTSNFGARGVWINVSVVSNSASVPWIHKVIVSYTVARF